MRIADYHVDPTYIYRAILGSRLSYGSGGKSDSEIVEGNLILGPADRQFCEDRIAASISGEDKFLRAIPVAATIYAPAKWWREFDTYKVGTVRQSSSLMHRTKRVGLFLREDFDVSDELWESEDFQHLFTALNTRVAQWIEHGRRNDKWNDWTEWQDMIPSSFVYVSEVMMNYAVLRNIYRVRAGHRMSTQWAPFCEWTQMLPEGWMISWKR